MRWLSRRLRRRGQNHEARRTTTSRLRATVEGLEGRVLLSLDLTRFPVSGVASGSVELGAMDAGPDGNIWFTESAGSTTLDQITADGRISLVATMPGQIAISALTNGPDGNVWYAGQRTLDQESNVTEAVVGRVSPSGNVAEFVVPNASFAQYITSGRDGNLWFTAGTSNGPVLVGRVTPDGQITEYPLPTQSDGSYPSGIVADGEGNIWVATNSASTTIFQVTTTGQVTEHILPQIRVPASRGMKAQMVAPYVSSMTVEPDGDIWIAEEVFSSTVRQVIVRVTPSGHFTRFTAFPSGVNDSPDQITAGPGRELFFSVNTMTLGLPNYQNEIGEISTSGRVSIIHLPKREFPLGPLIVEPGGNLWYLASDGINRLTLSGSHRRNGR